MAKVPKASSQRTDSPEEEDSGERLPPERKISYAILAALGRPPGLLSVDVRPLWDDYHRVNVLVGKDSTFIRIAHSFFIRTGASGVILASTPKIVRSYP